MAGKETENAHLRSSKNLWILISGSSLRSKELVGTELQTNLAKLSSGLSFYKHANSVASATKVLKDKKIDPKLISLMLQLSKLMNLDEVQCYELFCDFLLYDYKGSETSLQNATTDERSMQNLMLRVWDYYRCERLYLLLCVKEIFGHLNDESHPYQDLFKDFVNLLDKDSALQESFLEQWRLLQNYSFSGSKLQASVIGDIQTQTWTFNLREQCELLQVLLLFFKGKCVTGADVYSLFTTFKDHSFGRKHQHKQNADKNAEDILEAIRHLECLIIIQCLKLRSICSDNSRVSVEYHLSADKESFQKCDLLVSRLGYQKEHGPVMLAWTAVRSHVLTDMDASTTQTLGKSALGSGAFSYLQRILESPIFQGNGAVANCASTVIYDLLTALVLQFDESSLGNNLSLSRICYRLLQNRQITSDFWKQGLNQGVGLLLSTLISRFPHSFSPLVDVLSGLAAASSASAKSVLSTFQTLSFCTLARDPRIAVQDMYELEDEGYSLCLLEDYHPFGTDLICLPAGTFGCPSGDPKEEALIKWKFTLNGWTLCLVVVDELFQDLSTGKSQLVASSDLIIRVKSIADLVKNVLVSDSDLISQLFPLVDKLFYVSQRLVNLALPPMDLLALTLDTGAALSGNDGSGQTWWKIVQTGILPMHSSSQNLLSTSGWGKSDFGHGSIKKLITAHECVSGDYQLTLAFLGLVSAFIEDMAGGDDHHYIACVGFIVDELIPSYGKWWFRDVEQRELIGQRCFDVLNRVLGVPFASAGVTGNRDCLRKTVIQSLLYQEAGQSLLRLICTGEETIHRALERQSSWVSGRGLELIRLVKLALSVLNRLLVIRISGSEKDSPTVTALCSQPRTIRIVANYIYHRFDVRLATLGMLLMRRFARDLPISLMVCLGSDAVPFSKRLILRLEARTEDIHLKVAILKFLSSCVESQPGMTEAFVGTSNNAEGKSENSCLTLVIQILRQCCEKPPYLSKELRSAALSLLYALWFGRQVVALDALRTNSDLWGVLLDTLLDDGLDDTNYMAAAYTLGIFAEEFLLSPDQKHLKNFSEILEKRLIENNLLPLWAKKTYAALPPSDNDCANGEAAKDVVAFFKAFRSFLMIGTKVGHLSVPVAQKKSILDGCLDCLISNVSGPQDRTSVSILSETLLHLMHAWHEECRSHFTQWTERSSQLLKTVMTAKGEILTTVVCNILAICMCVIRALEPSKGNLAADEATLYSFMCVAADVVNRCLLEVEKALTNKGDAEYKSQLVVLGTSIVQKLSWICGNEANWLPELQRCSLLHALVNFTVGCLNLHAGLEPCLAVVELLASLSRFDRVCEILAASGLVQTLCLPMFRMPPVYEGGSTDTAGAHTSKSLTSKHACWSDVYEAGLRLITSVLRSQGHFVVTPALDFIVIHVDKFQMVPLRLFAHLDEDLLKSTIMILRFIHELSLFPSVWQLHSDSASRRLLDFTFTVCYISAAYLIRPQIILHSIGEDPKGNRQKLLDDEENAVRLRRISSTDETAEKPNSKLHSVIATLVEVLSVCVCIMCNFTPDLCELLSDQGYDPSRWIPLLEPGFSTPSPEQITPIGFGTILSCAAYCIKMLNMSDRATSPARPSSSETSVQNKQLTSFLLERSLYLVVSQAGLITARERETSWDRQLFMRELVAELSSCIQSRYVRRNASSVSPVVGASVSPSPSSQSSRSRLSLEKWPFLNLVVSIVEGSFK